MARLLLTRVTRLRGRMKPEQVPEDLMKSLDKTLVSVNLSECGTILTAVFDADKIIQNQVDEGYLPYKLPLMVLINNWRAYNKSIAQHVKDNPDLYYSSKKLYWHFEY